MSAYLAEFLGTMIMIYLGNSVVANVVLSKTKGHGAGLIVIAVGWAFAVVVPALMFGPASGAHFNSALTLALALRGELAWTSVPLYLLMQLLGAVIGSFLVYFQYKDHFDATADQDAKLGVFATSPAIRNFKRNFVSEVLGTFILVLAIFGISQTTAYDAGTLGVFGVGGIIMVIGVSLGGTTGYAINPIRDLGPRIAHYLLPIRDKRDSDWSYSWIPVVAPIVGALAATGIYVGLF